MGEKAGEVGGEVAQKKFVRAGRWGIDRVGVIDSVLLMGEMAAAAGLLR